MSQSSASNDAFNDSLNFVKKLWGQMGVPGMAAPTMAGVTIPGLPSMPLPSMSLEDLDKRIQELKTVETWLNVNMTMLRNTIQALEVQRATIATLHSLSSTMAKTMQDMGNDATNVFTSRAGQTEPDEPEESERDEESVDDTTNGEEVSPLIAQSAAWWQGVQDQFKHALGTALEKSTANYEAARSASENLVKATSAATSNGAKATANSGSKRAAPKAAAPRSKAGASTKTSRKAPAKPAARGATKSRVASKN